jgi:hypothetical protein
LRPGPGGLFSDEGEEPRPLGSPRTDFFRFLEILDRTANPAGRKFFLFSGFSKIAKAGRMPWRHDPTWSGPLV